MRFKHLFDWSTNMHVLAVRSALIVVIPAFLLSCGKEKKSLRGRLEALSSWAGFTTGKNSDNSSGKVGTWAYFPVRKGLLKDGAELNGKLEASERIELKAEKRLRIGPAKRNEGDHVKRGDVLFEVDTKELEQKRQDSRDAVARLGIELKSATAQFALVTKQLQRKKTLVEKGVVAQKELDDAQNEYEGAESMLKTKNLDLKKAERELANANQVITGANIVAPFEGIVTSIGPGGGDVNEGQTLAVVANPAELSVSVEVDETIVTKFKVGQKVDVKVDALSEKVLDGVVKSISSAARQVGSPINSYNLSVAIAPKVVQEYKLKDGYSARVLAVFAKLPETLIVPRPSIKQNGIESFLLVVGAKGAIPSARVVKLGLQTEMEVEILQGVKEGDFVTTVIESERGVP